MTKRDLTRWVKRQTGQTVHVRRCNGRWSATFWWSRPSTSSSVRRRSSSSWISRCDSVSTTPVFVSKCVQYCRLCQQACPTLVFSVSNTQYICLTLIVSVSNTPVGGHVLPPHPLPGEETPAPRFPGTIDGRVCISTRVEHCRLCQQVCPTLPCLSATCPAFFWVC